MTDAERQRAILEARARDATRAVLIAIGSAELMFLSFALGSSLGPVPLRPLEIILGSTATFLLGTFAALILVRRSHQRGAKLVAKVREGRRRHRVVIFDEYLTIGREVILRRSLDALELESKSLVLRYLDPQHKGPVLRELTGERGVLERVHALLR